MFKNLVLSGSLTDAERQYLDRVAGLIPVLRDEAAAAEEGRKVTAPVMDAAVEAGLFSALVPARFGGQALGLRSLTEAARLLARGDASTAWALAFLIEHNWMAGRMPIPVQEKLFADRNYMLAAAPLVSGGPATREEDGSYRITGTWRYGTGYDNSDWVFVTCTIQEEDGPVDRVFMLPVDAVEVVQRWEASGMAATSSHNLRGEDLIVPAERSLPIPDFVSADSHGGIEHIESIYHYPLHFGLNNMMAGIFVGIAEAVLDLYEGKLESSRPFGLARKERTPSRIRWAAARKRIEAARLLYFATIDWTVELCEKREGYTQEDIGELQLSSLTIAHMCHDAVNQLCMGIGSSAFALKDPIQRYKRDIDVLINHAGLDWDVVADRASRWSLGFGAETTDWHSSPAKGK
ncbi:acyl-CoA dehydrogenase family protein [Arthrobacter sp. I2-34]|uniref:Acyl-CoA dehydrogenase family protein n=1 Tax=Arthrobacter hankyongi TaxID=2904801 RepID=A0ABS9L398_9MICC|nr:acyl-CoA dehydrogenase family protein [Arthrobacter hankyongi]MCG2621128.1 acyl-CoA dehydrogenase family protein [Arthrobacter hankyongi]